jgi:hypothetical protein
MAIALGAAVGAAWSGFAAASRAAAFAGRPDAMEVDIASLPLQHDGSFRSGGGTESFGSLDLVCSQIMQNVSKDIQAGREGSSTRKLQQLMKGMRCVE